MSEETKFLNIASQVSEQFNDYLLMVKRKDGSLRWRYSDATWAQGAVTSFEDVVRGSGRVIDSEPEE